MENEWWAITSVREAKIGQDAENSYAVYVVGMQENRPPPATSAGQTIVSRLYYESN